MARFSTETKVDYFTKKICTLKITAKMERFLRMTKSELVLRIAEQNPHLFQRDVERIISTIFTEMGAALGRGDRVELRGFGAFSVKQRGARTGRNPRTGQPVKVPKKVVPFFKTGKQLRELINSN